MSRGPRKLVSGKRKRVLLVGEYPLLPGGNIWFELIIEVGYRKVDESQREELERELQTTLEKAQTCFAWVREWTPDKVVQREVSSRHHQGERDGASEHDSAEAESYTYGPFQTAWEDTEPPAPPEEEG